MRDILQSRYLRSNVAHKHLARTSLNRNGTAINLRGYPCDGPMYYPGRSGIPRCRFVSKTESYEYSAVRQTIQTIHPFS